MEAQEKKRLIMLGCTAAPLIALGVFINIRGRSSGDALPPQLQQIASLEQNRDAVGLRRLASEKDPKVATAAVAAMATLPNATKELEPLTRDDRLYVREAAVASYASVTSYDNVEVINRAVSDPSRSVRATAAKALGDLRAWGGLNALLKGLSDPDRDVRQTSYHSIETITGVKFPYNPDASLAECAQVATFISKELPKLKGNYDLYMKKLKADQRR